MREIKFRAWDGDDTASHKDGEYTYVKAPWHPMANKRGYVKRHRLVLEAYMHEYLPKNAIVHHKDGDKRNDKIDNLEYQPDQKFHAKKHDNGKRNPNGQFVASDPVFSEIKFRLYNKHTKLFEIHTLGKLIKTTFRNSQFTFAGRFTGLRDKNGIEIYEGDIVHVNGIMTPAVVIFDCEMQSVILGSVPIYEWVSAYACFISELEVIGNIHENPELLDK